MNPWGQAPPLTDARFFNAARLTVTLLVEGHSDAKFWRARVDATCQIRVMGDALVRSLNWTKLKRGCARDGRGARYQIGTSVREELVCRAEPIGRLRWVSLRDALKLTFRKSKKDRLQSIDYGKFCDRKSWTMDVRAMVQTVLDFSGVPRSEERINGPTCLKPTCGKYARATTCSVCLPWGFGGSWDSKVLPRKCSQSSFDWPLNGSTWNRPRCIEP